MYGYSVLVWDDWCDGLHRKNARLIEFENGLNWMPLDGFVGDYDIEVRHNLRELYGDNFKIIRK